MGGRVYWDAKGTVEQRSDLSIFRLKQWGYLEGCHGGTLTWTWGLSGRQNSIGLWVDTVSSEPFAKVNYTVTDRTDGSKQDYDYRIRLLTTPCNLGGRRFWFCCPHCGRRSGVLHIDGGLFVCRLCANLTYESRNESRMGRPGGIGYFLVCERRADEIRKKMKRRTWRGRPTRKMLRIERLEAKSTGCYETISRFLAREPKTRYRVRKAVR